MNKSPLNQVSNQQRLAISMILVFTFGLDTFAEKTTVYLSKPKADAFTLEMAKQQALDGGETTVQIAREQIEESKGSLEAAQGLRKPTLNASVGMGVMNKMGDTTGAFGSHNIGISFPFLNNSITTSINSAKNTELAREQLYLAQLNQAMLAVTIDYYNTVKANKDVVVASKLVEASQAYYNSELNKMKSGIGSKIDMLTAKVQLDNAKISFTNAQASAALTCTSLITLINNEDLGVCARLVEPVVPSRFNVNTTSALNRALNSRPEVMANQDLIAAARDQRAGIGGWKNHVSGSFGVSNSSANPSGIPGIVPLHNGSINTVGATITLTWGGSDQGNIKAANSRIDQATTMLTDAQKNIRRDVLNAQTILAQAYANKSNAQMAFDDASSLIQTYQGQVKSGINIMDSNAYVQDLTKYQQAQQALFEADCNVAEAIAQLQAAVGAPASMNIFEFLVSGLL